MRISKFHRMYVIVGAVLALANAAAADGPSRYYWISSTSVESLKRDLSKVQPAIDNSLEITGVGASVYLRPMAVLGYYGPLGPYGPAGILGPIGDNSWNPSAYISSSKLSDFWQRLLRKVLKGPLTAGRPLGAAGPLNTNFWKSLTDIPGAFLEQLEPGGVWSVLGVGGLYSPVGPFGPLGPIGALGTRGLTANSRGEWVDKSGKVQREIRVPWTAKETRSYRLFEKYDARFAAEMSDNDDSFMVEDKLARGLESFEFTTSAEGHVSIVVTPDFALYNFAQAMGILAASAMMPGTARFDIPPMVGMMPYLHKESFDDFNLELEVLDKSGRAVERIDAESDTNIDWIVARLPKNTRLRATVKLAKAWMDPFTFRNCMANPIGCVPAYRLYVIGFAPESEGAKRSGPHLHEINL